MEDRSTSHLGQSRRSDEREIRHSAQQVFAILNRKYQLTQEQIAAIELAPIDRPALVVAGAGAGKTEVMAVRVIWLIANELAAPEQILGLTFTRKAASSLAKRVNESIQALVESEICPASLTDDFTPPTIATYHSFANSLFREHALSLGYEPDAQALSDASAFRLARRVVVEKADDLGIDLSQFDTSVNRLVGQVIELAQQINDNKASAASAQAAFADAHRKIALLPKKEGQPDFDHFQYIHEILDKLSASQALAVLADEFQSQKKLQGFVDFSDQVALAERLISTQPEIAEQLRDRFRFVLLDEYQDTSFLQTRMLGQAFSNHPVLAVGDPNQSIYGWRGASATNLSEFYAAFGVAPQADFTLSTSTRNPHSVLQLANKLVEPLSVPPSFLSREQQDNVAKVAVLQLKPLDSANPGIIDAHYFQNTLEEAASAANWLRQRLSQDNDKVESPTAAILFRKREAIQQFAEALDAVGLDYEIIGVGGLLQLPEITDLTSALRAIYYPSAGTQLIRLLTGPRWRIAPSDIAGLYRIARSTQKLNLENASASEAIHGPDDSISIVEALDQFANDNFESEWVSSDAVSRFRDAAKTLQNMRGLIGLPLPELVRAVAQELWLDIELQANPRKRNPLLNLEQFYSVAEDFSATSNGSDLSGFLDWLDFAESKERLEVTTIPPKHRVVQLLTVHSAKGLEWDYVVVPNLTEDDFPTRIRDGSGWLSPGKLPFELRGDRNSLPILKFEGVRVQSAFKAQALADFKAAISEMHEREERRLAYVAVTRTKRGLLLSGAYFKFSSEKARQPSQYIEEVAEFAAPEPDPAKNISLKDITASWPSDPLGPTHRVAIEQAAQQFEQALKPDSELVTGDSPAFDSSHEQLEILLAEQLVKLQNSTLVELPTRIAATRFRDFITSPNELAQRYRRPIPLKPMAAAAAGNVFHSWLESKFSQVVKDVSGDDDFSLDSEIYDLVDFSAEQAPEIALQDVTQKLRQTFESSQWAKKEPTSVEEEIQVKIGQQIFICKIDAVYQDGDLIEIVDWKTGSPPKTGQDLLERNWQLALYRLAYSKHHGIPESRIRCSFYFVAHDLTLTAENLPTIAELEAKWTAFTESLAARPTAQQYLAAGLPDY